MSREARSSCPHVTTVGDNAWEEVELKRSQQLKCNSCTARGPNLWLCLHSRCLYVGCGESAVDHSSLHSEERKHYLTLNMTTKRIWCYSCECEVFRDGNNPPLIMRGRSLLPSVSDNATSPCSSPMHSSSPPEEESDSDEEEEDYKPRGLTGLQNIGNTCYMNAAIQTLSNCPPVTRFFLDCPGFVRTDKKPMLSKSYLKLITEMWHRRRPSYVVPTGVAHGIKVVHPMFRGYTQQDSQEFLRCFMDQTHEELKQPCVCEETDDEGEELVCESRHEDTPEPATHDIIDEAAIEQPTHTDNGQSDTDYETCDSGMSSERSSVEHGIVGDDNGDSNQGNNEQQREEKPESENQSQPEVIGQSPKETQDDTVINRTDKNNCNVENIPPVTSASDSEIGKIQSPKELKETANIACKNAAGEGSSVGSDSGTITIETTDSGEFSDAVSELEPLQCQKSRSASIKSTHSAGAEKKMRGTSPHGGSCGPGAVRGKKRSVEYHSVISDIFDGKILSSVQCLTCERVSSTKETFQDLSLPIPSKDHIHMLHASHNSHSKGGTCGEVNLHQGWLAWMFGWMKSWFWGPTITLRDCLAAFFSADELKGDNMYSCEKCKKLRNGVKYSKVMELPEILCIHLKRFRHEFMFSTKINSYVAFPVEGLDMGPYLHKDCKCAVPVYDLVGVICHHGTAGGGHYTAYALNHVNEQWYEFDDQYVTEVDIQQVENCEAYVLFYRKKNEGMYSLRQKAREMIENPENSLLKFYVSRQWINKFNTFSEPGPISNHDFLCRHGGVTPQKWPYVEELYTTVSQSLWQFLHDQFGGGPAVNHIYLCTTCQTEIEKLKKRQKYEMETFIQLNSDFQKEENPNVIYVISMAWFKEWENFVRARYDEPPGPIDNSRIAVTRHGQPTVKMSSDYGQLSEEMWLFLYDIYSGGPELILRQNQPTMVEPKLGDVHDVTKLGDGSKP